MPTTLDKPRVGRHGIIYGASTHRQPNRTHATAKVSSAKSGAAWHVSWHVWSTMESNNFRNRHLATTSASSEPDPLGQPLSFVRGNYDHRVSEVNLGSRGTGGLIKAQEISVRSKVTIAFGPLDRRQTMTGSTHQHLPASRKAVRRVAGISWSDLSARLTYGVIQRKGAQA